MTTLADINETLTVQNEMQEKTTKAVMSLANRFTAFLRVSKGDNLESLEQRREARRQNRAAGFINGAKRVGGAVKNNIGLISKILGGLALTAFVLQNDELRTAVIDFITAAGEGIATFFKSDGFKEILSATFSAAGNVFTSLLGTVWETDGGKAMLIGLGVALAAIFAGPAVVAALAGAILTAATKVVFKAGKFALTTPVVPDYNSKDGIRKVPQPDYNSKDGIRKVPQSTRPLYTPPDEFFKKRQSGLKSFLAAAKNATKVTRVLPIASAGLSGALGAFDQEAIEAGVDLPSRVGLGITQGVAETGDAAQFLARELLNKQVPGLGDVSENILDVFLRSLNSTISGGKVTTGLPGVGNTPTSAEAYREFAIPLLAEAGRNEQQRQANPVPNFYLDRITSMGAGQNYIPPAQSSLEYNELMRQHMLYSNPQSKIPAIQQGMAGAGTGITVVPVPIPMDSGKGPGPVVVQGTTGGSLSAGETIHLNQDPATIIGGTPRQQSGGGGGW